MSIGLSNVSNMPVHRDQSWVLSSCASSTVPRNVSDWSSSKHNFHLVIKGLGSSIVHDSMLFKHNHLRVTLLSQPAQHVGQPTITINILPVQHPPHLTHRHRQPLSHPLHRNRIIHRRPRNHMRQQQVSDIRPRTTDAGGDSYHSLTIRLPLLTFAYRDSPRWLQPRAVAPHARSTINNPPEGGSSGD